MKNLEIKLFLLIAFLLGTWGALFESVQTILLGIGVILNLVKYKKEFWENIKKYKYYLLLPIIVMVYTGIHAFFIIYSGKYADVKPSFGVFEKLALCFLLVSVYVVSCRSFMTLKILKQFLLFFCIGVFSFNVVMLFHLEGLKLLTSPLQAIMHLYETRFGSTKYFLGGQVYLDAEAMHIYVAALISYFAGITASGGKMKFVAFAGFIVFVWFLSLTVTKSSILGFFCGFVLFNFYFLRKLSVRYRYILISILVGGAILTFVFRPASFDRRWQQMKDEIEDVRNGELEGGSSITPRVVFYKSCFEHIDEWGIWGLGVYTERVSKQWYLESGNKTVAALTHSHNSYLQYWMWMGIVGLCFILSWFCLPIMKMFKLKKFSFLAISIIAAFFVDCQFEVQLVVNDALPMVIFFLAMFYVYVILFYEIEKLSVSFGCRTS